MTLEEIKSVITAYKRDLGEIYSLATGVSGGEMPDGLYNQIRESKRGVENANHAMAYLLRFFDKIEDALAQPEPDVEKIMRWLGFVQGALWVCGIYGVGALRKHNKTGEVPYL